MIRTPFFTSLALLSLALPSTAQDKDKPKPKQDAKAAAVSFEQQIWPILEKRCIECHSTAAAGPDGKMKKPKGGVVLDSKDGITSSKKGELVVAKKPDDSLMYKSITLAADHEDRMPPAKKGEPLSKDETDLIKQWIEGGADLGKWTGKKAEAGKGKGDDKGKAGDKPKEGEKKEGDKPKGK